MNYERILAKLEAGDVRRIERLRARHPATLSMSETLELLEAEHCPGCDQHNDIECPVAAAIEKHPRFAGRGFCARCWGWHVGSNVVKDEKGVEHKREVYRSEPLFLIDGRTGRHICVARCTCGNAQRVYRLAEQHPNIGATCYPVRQRDYWQLHRRVIDRCRKEATDGV